ncbi:MAG: deoxyribonuclease IV [Armatimonadota bacterium]
MRLGFHVSVAGGLQDAVVRALRRRCQTLQVFAAAPSRWKRRDADPAEDAWFVEARRHHDLHPLFVHAPYLLNPATDDERLWVRSRDVLQQEIETANRWRAAGVIIHLGSAGQQPKGDAVAPVCTALDEVRAATDGSAKIILENSAGQGRSVGSSMAEIGTIIRSAGRERLAVCLDTAHAFAAGYAVNTKDGLARMLDEADSEFGLAMVEVIHLNGSKSELGSHVDRHAGIGQGHIGRDGFKTILTEPRLNELPFIMETPKSSDSALEDDLTNLRRVRRLLPANLRPPLPPQFKNITLYSAEA